MAIAKPTQDFMVALSILVAFCMPLYLLLISIATTDGFKSMGSLLQWTVSFLANQDSALAQFHKILLPLVTGISAWKHKDATSGQSVSLLIFCTLNIMLAIVADVFFRDRMVIDAITANYPNYSAASATAYFTRIQETLMMYLMLLMGLKAAKS